MQVFTRLMTALSDSKAEQMQMQDIPLPTSVGIVCEQSRWALCTFCEQVLILDREEWGKHPSAAVAGRGRRTAVVQQHLVFSYACGW